MSREEEGDDYGRFYEPPTLGDLPRGVAHERGETWPQETRGRLPPNQAPGRGGGLPGQVADQARGADIKYTLQNEKISPIAPALAYQVQSTYDARPVQGRDFQASGCDTLVFEDAGGGASATFATVAFTYLVPDNTVAVLRQFRYEVQNAPINMVQEGECWLQSDLFVNDLPVRDYSQMFHAVFMQNPFDCFIIADQRTRIKIALSHPKPTADTVLASAVIGVTSPVLFEFYGNIILKSGIPIEFEIANKIAGF